MSDAEVMAEAARSMAKVAFINSQVACALVEMEGMKAANQERIARGEALAYSDTEVFALIDKYVISHNDVIGYLYDR